MEQSMAAPPPTYIPGLEPLDQALQELHLALEHCLLAVQRLTREGVREAAESTLHYARETMTVIFNLQSIRADLLEQAREGRKP